MFCPNCGKETHEGFSFCEECGFNLKSQSNPTSAPKIQPAPAPVQAAGVAVEQKNDSDKSALIIGVLAGLLVLVLLVGGAGFMFVMGVGPFSKNGDAVSKTGPDEGGEVDEIVESSYEELEKLLGDRDDINISLKSSDVTDYPTVKLYFTIEDDQGNVVELTDPKVAIMEKVSGEKELEQKVKSLKRLEGNSGVSIDLIADKSASMSSDFYSMQSIMTQFVQSLDYDTGDRAELIAFDTFVMYMCTYTDDEQLLKNGIDNMTTYGDTALYDALYEGVRNAGNQSGAHCVIAFTDGEDNSSIHTVNEVIALAEQYSVPIYIVGTAQADYYTLENICEESGGKYWDISYIDDLKDVLDEIYALNKDMYCLTYESEAGNKAYVEREISCIIGDSSRMGKCDDSFTPVEIAEKAKHDKRYELVTADISWTDANEAAIAKGGHLITITSEDENKQAAELAEAAGIEYVWIGGYTSEKNNSVYGHWVTGENFSYSKWFDGEPSRNDLDGEPEFYLMLWHVGDDWTWNDQRNDPVNLLDYFKGKTGYIIEYEN